MLLQPDGTVANILSVIIIQFFVHFIKNGLCPVFHHAFRNGVFLKTLGSAFARCIEKQSK